MDIDALRHSVHNAFRGVVEAVTPVPTVSRFEQDRTLTPKEFMTAGDYLTSVSGAWRWEGGEAAKRVSYLDENKQFLVTRGVPCHKRATAMERYADESMDASDAAAADGDDWVRPPAVSDSKATLQDISSVEDHAAVAGELASRLTIAAETGATQHAAQHGDSKHDGDDDDIPDIDDAGEDEVDEATFVPPPAAAATADEGDDAGVLRMRTYDLYITYDAYYRVPRFWLVGYDEDNRPLTFEQMLEDISEEHARKTVTKDPHPHLSMPAAYIHPCKHAAVMKKLADARVARGDAFGVEGYLVLFLKFIASIVPTIEYDYTMAFNV